MQYQEKCLWQIKRPYNPITARVNVRCVYYMATRRKVDLANLIEATCDILVKAKVLTDDNSQIIQPYMFGDEYMKTTCLWLKNIPGLFATDIVIPTSKWVSSSDHRAVKRKDAWSQSGNRTAKQRSKTFPGIAKAMSEQWG